MTHINFPNTFDTDESLYIAVNNIRTRLTAPIASGVDTIPVVTTDGFPATGFISILTGSDITKTEAITYSGISSTAFLNAGRGADGTAAFEHISNDNVDLTIVADHHNSLKDAIFELERYVGVSGAENFLRIDDDGDVSIPGTITVSGGADFAFVTVTGTLSVSAAGDFKEDINVSGTLFVGELPVSTTPKATFKFEDTIFNTGTDNTYQETGVSIVPDSGLNLVLWRENASAGSEGIAGVELKATYLGSALTEVGTLFSTQGGHWNASELMGFKVIDADGTSSVKLHARAVGSARSGDVGAQQLISVPLGQMGLASGTDFWYDNGIESDTSITTTFPTQTTVTSMPVNVSDAGSYLVMMSHDTKQPIVAGNGSWAARLYVNEINVSSHMDKEGSSGVAEYQNAPWAQVVTLVAGLNTIELRASRWAGVGTLNMRRGRLCVIKGSSFDQMQGTRSFTDVGSNTDTFSEITALSQTYTPNQREQVLVFGSVSSESDDITGTKAVATYKIRDDTDGIDYATDFGTPVGHLSNSVHAFSFALKENTIVPTDWKMFIREANSSSNTGTMNHGAMAIWSLSTNPITSTQFTRITGSKILSPDIDADTITVINSGTLTLDGGDLVAPTGTFSTSLTISGIPVSTGTGNGTTDHSALTNLDFASAGHTGFGSSADTDALAASGVALSAEIDSDISTHAAIANAHHDKYTDGEAIIALEPTTSALAASGVATDANVTANSAEILTVSGHLQGEIDATQPDVDAITVSGGSNTTGVIDYVGSGGVNVSKSGQIITFDGTGVAGAGGGGGGGNIDSINAQTGPAITITGVGTVNTLTDGNTITISGSDLPSFEGDGFRGFVLTSTSGVDVTGSASSGFVRIPWDTAVIDTDSFSNFAGDDAVITIPAGIDKMRFGAKIQWNSTDEGGSRALNIRKVSGPTKNTVDLVLEISNVSAAMDSNDYMKQSGWSEVVDVVVGELWEVVPFWSNATSASTITIGDSSLNNRKGLWFAGEVIDPVAIPDDFTVASGTFTQSLTVSGIPVATGTGPFYAIFGMADSATQTLTDASFTQVTSLTETKINDGGFISDGAGLIEVPTGQGYTHVQILVQITFDTNTTGGREVTMSKDGLFVWTTPDGISIANVFTRTEASSINASQPIQVFSPIVAVSGGDQFKIFATQRSGGDLDIIESSPPGLTYLMIEGFKR